LVGAFLCAKPRRSGEKNAGAFFSAERSTDPNRRNPRNFGNALRFSRPPNQLGAFLSTAPVPPRRGFLFFCYAQPARQTAHGLIQGYIGPDHKVIDMKAFFAALVQALKDFGRY